MALSEVWRYDPNLEGTPTPFDVWVEPRTNAPIAVATRFRQSSAKASSWSLRARSRFGCVGALTLALLRCGGTQRATTG